jgi:hypothetical protein
VQKAPALLHRSSCASRLRTALCASLAVRRLPLRAPDASSSLLGLYFLSHRIPDVQDAIPPLIRSGCGLSVVLSLALCASDAGEGGTRLGFGVLAPMDLRPNNRLILS